MIRILAALLGGLSAVAVAQPAGQVPSGTTLFQLDLSRTPVGEIPASIDVVNGILEVVLKNGMPMLKASALSEFRITLQPPGQVLPPDFTLEFDLIPKQGSNPQDLSVEGTANINQGDASAHVLWHATGSLSVIGGGGDTYETPMPEDFQASLPGVLTKVILEVEGPTLKLYTNGRRLYTLRKQFARGGVLRVYLGAQNGGTEAVYLAGLRVTAGAGLGLAGLGGGGGQQGGQLGGGQLGQQGGQGQQGQQGQQGGQQGGQLQQLKNNPLSVVPNPNTQQSQNPQQQPQTASNQFGLTGTLSSAAAPTVTVTTSGTGPLVDWTPVFSPGVYTVQRWKLDDPLCCNATSPASPPLTTPPWQDSPLPVSGTYVYQVTLTTDAGAYTGQTQFVWQPGVPSAGGGSRTPPASTTPPTSQPPPPPPTALPPAGPTGTITPLPAPPPPPPPTVTTPISGQAGLPTTSPTRPLPGSLGGNLSGRTPQNPSLTGTPAWVRVTWSAPSVTIRGVVYNVDRYLESNPTCCIAKATGLATMGWTDEGTQWAGTYVYRITAVYPDGSGGYVDVKWVRPDPVNPTNFRASPGVNNSVILQWDPVPNVDWYYLFGPGVPFNPFAVTPPVTHFVVTGLPSGTYTWQIGSYYSSPNAPAPVSTAATAFPKVTFTLP